MKDPSDRDYPVAVEAAFTRIRGDFYFREHEKASSGQVKVGTTIERRAIQQVAAKANLGNLERGLALDVDGAGLQER